MLVHDQSSFALLVCRLPTGFSLRADGVISIVLKTCSGVLRTSLVRDFVDQLLALDFGHSGLACLLVFSVAAWPSRTSSFS